MPEEQIGIVTHYFGHIQVAAIRLDAELKVGDTIHIKGHTTDLIQTIDSMQFEHQSVQVGTLGQEIAIKLKEHARQHDTVFKVTP